MGQVTKPGVMYQDLGWAPFSRPRGLSNICRQQTAGSQSRREIESSTRRVQRHSEGPGKPETPTPKVVGTAIGRHRGYRGEQVK